MGKHLDEVQVMPRQLHEATSSEDDMASSEQEPKLASVELPVLPEFKSDAVQPRLAPRATGESRRNPTATPEVALPGGISSAQSGSKTGIPGFPPPQSWEEIKRGCLCNQLQRDFSNLDKSLSKWLVHREIGVLTHGKLLDKIRTSSAMRRLADREGERFQLEVFLSLALKHAETDRVSRQTRAGGA